MFICENVYLEVSSASEGREFTSHPFHRSLTCGCEIFFSETFKKRQPWTFTEKLWHALPGSLQYIYMYKYIFTDVCVCNCVCSSLIIAERAENKSGIIIS